MRAPVFGMATALPQSQIFVRPSHSVNNFPLHPTLDVTRALEVVMIVALFQKNRYTTSEEYTDIHPI